MFNFSSMFEQCLICSFNFFFFFTWTFLYFRVTPSFLYPPQILDIHHLRLNQIQRLVALHPQSLNRLIFQLYSTLTFLWYKFKNYTNFDFIRVQLFLLLTYRDWYCIKCIGISKGLEKKSSYRDLILYVFR